MDSRYRGILIGNWHHPEDQPNLPDLKGPLNDVSRLAEALVDKQVGLFDPSNVMVLAERDSHVISAAPETHFAEATRDQILLM